MRRHGQTPIIREDRPLYALIATVMTAGVLAAVSIASALLTL